MPRTRALVVDGIDTLLSEPTSTGAQPDGWGWDWERWRRSKPASAGARAAA